MISFLPGSAHSSHVLYLECVSSRKGFISILILAKIGFVAWRASEDCSVISAHGASLFRSPVFGGRAHTVMSHPLCWVRLGGRAGCLLPAQVSTLQSLDSCLLPFSSVARLSLLDYVPRFVVSWDLSSSFQQSVAKNTHVEHHSWDPQSETLSHSNNTPNLFSVTFLLFIWKMTLLVPDWT